MVKKRLSKEYMALLQRNQNSVMTVGQAQPPPLPEDDEPHGQKYLETPVEDIQVNCVEEIFEIERENEENAFNDCVCHEIKHCQDIGVDEDNDIVVLNIESPTEPIYDSDFDDKGVEQTVNDERNMIKAYLRRSLQAERQAARIAPPTRRRRRDVSSTSSTSYPVTSSSFERLMAVVRSERSKHREMINLLQNTSFAMSRRPLVTKSRFVEKRMWKHRESHLNPTQADPLKKNAKLSENNQIFKSERKYTKSVHFGTMVTFDDHSTPVPIRPPRKKTQRIPVRFKMTSVRSKIRGCRTTPSISIRRKTLLRKTQDSEEALGAAPEKPARIYKGRGCAGVTQVVQPLVSRHYQSAMGESRI